ncbi:hypothetical protein BDP55DRAFT_419429 [Colletotrichum godetiae]|uniref:Zn(2)-C6 fungal-type domain-containing protein n=1 Tax=Colletotrichum godetiae TaxID=1209918 RepID=A0AAJ0ELN0_9PEZI|nr:uncharacterized protein BDP55DRAFT_419429 [Colletotrichum godetiae]KAK1657735.1 hypothetical protein BDP55DRAFT_419429 [Colletotrichum godetiae]
MEIRQLPAATTLSNSTLVCSPKATCRIVNNVVPPSEDGDMTEETAMACSTGSSSLLDTSKEAVTARKSTSILDSTANLQVVNVAYVLHTGSRQNASSPEFEDKFMLAPSAGFSSLAAFGQRGCEDPALGLGQKLADRSAIIHRHNSVSEVSLVGHDDNTGDAQQPLDRGLTRTQSAPLPPTTDASHHPDALRCPPPSSTMMSPLGVRSGTGDCSNRNNTNITAPEQPPGHRPVLKPRQSLVMTIQNALGGTGSAADAARQNASGPSQSPAPLIAQHTPSLILPATMPYPAACSSPSGPLLYSSAPTSTLIESDAPKSMIASQLSPSGAVTTVGPQSQSFVCPEAPGCENCKVSKMLCDKSRPTCFNCSRMGVNCFGHSDSSSPSEPPPFEQSATSDNSRPDQKEFLRYLVDLYGHAKGSGMWDLITSHVNQHYRCKMSAAALQMIRSRDYNHKQESSPGRTSANVPLSRRPAQKKRGRRPKEVQAMPSSTM